MPKQAWKSTTGVVLVAPVFLIVCLLVLLPEPEFAPRMVDYYRRNRDHLAPWEPRRSHEFLTAPWWERQLEANRLEFQKDSGARLVLVARDDSLGPVLGVANLSNIVRGTLHACHLGYSLDREHEGRGLMQEALEALLTHAFGQLQLHRVMANYQPENLRSARLLERLGFVREGYARHYLHIDGAWRDHVLTALVRDDPPARDGQQWTGSKGQGPAGTPGGPL